MMRVAHGDSWYKHYWCWVQWLLEIYTRHQVMSTQTSSLGRRSLVLFQKFWGWWNLEISSAFPWPDVCWMGGSFAYQLVLSFIGNSFHHCFVFTAQVWSPTLLQSISPWENVCMKFVRMIYILEFNYWGGFCWSRVVSSQHPRFSDPKK